MPVFSIIVVCLNAGEKLIQTVQSICRQTFDDYEILVKDGGSSDGSVEWLERINTKGKLKIYQEKDCGIYDAMNQAVRRAQGKYVFFLNCGDNFYEDTVLKTVYRNMKETEQLQICYGNLHEKLTDSIVYSNPHMDAFGCYRNVPCHQTCFYDMRLFQERGYDISYRVRADYEHFLWSYFVKSANMVYVPVTVASYEGGGFSETGENRKVSAKEHETIVKQYMLGKQILKYRLLLLLTLSPLRTKIAESRALSGIYNNLKKRMYRK